MWLKYWGESSFYWCAEGGSPSSVPQRRDFGRASELFSVPRDGVEPRTTLASRHELRLCSRRASMRGKPSLSLSLCSGWESNTHDVLTSRVFETRLSTSSSTR